MNILIIGIGSPVPTFIMERLKILDGQGINLYLFSYKSETYKFKDFKNAKLLIQDPNILDAIFRVIFHPYLFLKLVFVSPKNYLFNKNKWAIKQIPLVKIKNIDIIHLQWVNMGCNYSWLKEFHNAPLVGSARGSQVTIYPIVNVASYNELLKSFNVLDYIHCVSEDIKYACIKHGCKSKKLKVIYNGVNTDKFLYRPSLKVKKSHDFGNSYRLISVGAIMWRKGYIYQLILLKELLKICKVELIIIGEGQDWNSIVYTAHIMGLSSNVKLLGPLPNDDIVSHLQNSDIYISTSIAEGLPNSVMEAASCGLPVVAFNCEGIVEIVEDNKNGYVIPFGDLSQFLLRLKEILLDDELRLMMSEYSACKMKKEFDVNIHNKELIKFYNNIIDLNESA